MGQPVVHFEIEGLDSTKLRSFYHDLFGWDAPAGSPMDYAIVSREENTNKEGIGIGGGITSVPEQPSTTWKGKTRAEGYKGHVTFYIQVPDVEEALIKAEALGGKRMQGPDEVAGGIMMGKFMDPEGHLIGLTTAATP